MTPGRKSCPHCHGQIPAAANWCGYCGRNLLPDQKETSDAAKESESYEIVPDGSGFAIAFQGKIRVHGLDLRAARLAVAALNSRFDNPDKQ